MLKRLKEFKWGYILLFLLIMAVGICFIAWHNTLNTLAIVIGALVAAYGIFLVVAASRGAGYTLRIITGIASIICGVITIFVRDGAMEIIASLICLFCIIDGSFKLQTTVLSKRYHLLSWWAMLIPSVLCIIGGFIALKMTPNLLSDDKVTAVSLIIGITLIIDSISNLLSAFYIGKYERNMRAELESEIYGKLEAQRIREAAAAIKTEEPEDFSAKTTKDKPTETDGEKS